MAAPKKLLHLDEPEVLKLMAAACARPGYADRDHAVIAVMFYMGLNTSEAHRLDTVEIRFGKAVVYVRGSRGPRTLRLDPTPPS
jgi:site-specific recombinase XerC